MAKKQDILTTALERFQECDDYFKDEYIRGEDDILFAIGNQWPEQIKQQRQRDNRPCLTENRLMTFVHQVINDIRQTRPAINVTPVDDDADIRTAEVFKGIIRNIENQSGADNVYDTAANSAIMSGYGWIRILTEYDEGTFDQKIKLERVLDPFSVYLDPNAKELDGSDAEFAFVFIDMPLAKFKKEYPKLDPKDFEKKLERNGWMSNDTIRIAEYFWKEKKPYTLVKTVQGNMPYNDAVALGLDILEQREDYKCVIRWAKMTGADVLEESEWVGKYIPIVPVYGEEAWVEGRRKMYSLVHQAKDSQRMLNYWKTASTEIVALQPKAPWVAAEGQLEGYENKWASSNIQNHSVLTYRPVSFEGQLLPAPQRQAPPMGSQIMVQEVMLAADSIKATLGIYDASLGARGNETSGRAILARQSEGDNATFHFVDNLATSIRQVGRILLDLIPRIYTGPQVLRILGEDNEPAIAAVNQPAVRDGKGYKPDALRGDIRISLDAGEYDVNVTVGPSYGSKRQEAAVALTEIAKADPRLLEVAGDIFFKMQDFPMANEIADRLKKLLPPILQDQNDQDAQMRLAQAEQAIQMSAQQIEQLQIALQEAQAKAQSNEAKVLEVQIKAEQLNLERKKIELEALKINADIQYNMAKLDLEADKINAEMQLKGMDMAINANTKAKEIDLKRSVKMEVEEEGDDDQNGSTED